MGSDPADFMVIKAGGHDCLFLYGWEWVLKLCAQLRAKIYAYDQKVYPKAYHDRFKQFYN